MNLRRLLGSGSILLASLLASLLLLEAGVRLWDGVPLFSTDNFVARELDAVRKGGVAIYDARLGWISRPNSSWASDTLTFGEYGVRMPSSRIEALQQGAILVSGDSFAAGSEVPDADSWPAQLERSIGSQVINAGVGGYGLDQIVLHAEELVEKLHPRLVLIQTRLEFGISVDRMSVYGGAPKPFFTIQGGRLRLNNEPVPRVADRRSELGWMRLVFGHSYLIQYVLKRLNKLQWWVSPSMAIQFASSEEQGIDVTCLLMERLARLRQKAPVAFVIQYSGVDALNPHLGWEKGRDRVLACARDQNLDIVDTLDVLRSAHQRSLDGYRRLWMMHDNDRVYGHMSPEGNRLIAELIYKHMVADKLPSVKDTTLDDAPRNQNR